MIDNPHYPEYLRQKQKEIQDTTDFYRKVAEANRAEEEKHRKKEEEEDRKHALYLEQLPSIPTKSSDDPWKSEIPNTQKIIILIPQEEEDEWK